MAFFDFLTRTKRPAPGAPPKSPEEVRTALLAVNRPTAPWIVRDGAPEGVDLVAEWRIADATWRDMFGAAGLKKSFKVLMRLDAAKREVRHIDESRESEWSAGIGGGSWSTETSTGQLWESSWGKGVGYTETSELGVVYEYRFVSSELKTPLQEAVLAVGWTWRGVLWRV